MGEIVLAAKCTHAPTMIMPEQEGPIFGKRQAAIDGHVEIAKRAKALGWDSYDKSCEAVIEYFPSSGTGQNNVIFPL